MKHNRPRTVRRQIRSGWRSVGTADMKTNYTPFGLRSVELIDQPLGETALELAAGETAPEK